VLGDCVGLCGEDCAGCVGCRRWLAGSSSSGQIVVEIAMTDVTTFVEWAGQFVTVTAQLVIV